jgi:hypothetical protein
MEGKREQGKEEKWGLVLQYIQLLNITASVATLVANVALLQCNIRPQASLKLP